MIYVRADGNSKIGMGHVMRCLSIADAFRKENAQVKFITACRECEDIIKNRGYEVILLDTDYTNMEAEIPKLNEIIEKEDKETNVILIDSYQMTNEYVEKLRRLGQVACLDDTFETYPCDILINYNIYASKEDYLYKSFPDKMLLGASYAPLREEFMHESKYELKEDAKNVMITTGGSDPKNATAGLLVAFLKNKMLNNKEVTYHVVIGPLNPFRNELVDHYKDNKQVILYENVTNMREIMEKCDVIVTATGSTVYEACAIGIPMICFYYAENQRRIAEYFDKNTDVINCGDYSFNEKIVCFNATDALVRCIIGRETRNELSRQEKSIVDGQGAIRIAKELIIRN